VCACIFYSILWHSFYRTQHCKFWWTANNLINYLSLRFQSKPKEFRGYKMLAHGLSHFDLANPIRRCLKPIKTAFATIQCRVEWCGWLGSNMGRWCYWSFWLWSRTLLLGTVLWCFFSKLLWECVTFLVQSEIGIFCGFFIMCVNGKLSCANGFGFSLWNINFCFGNWLVPHGFSWDNVCVPSGTKNPVVSETKANNWKKKKKVILHSKWN